MLFPISRGYSQYSKRIDSLSMLKDYLRKIQVVVNAKQGGKEKVFKLDSLIGLGTSYRSQFKQQLKVFVMDGDERNLMQRSFDFILQSLVLYKVDLKEIGSSPMEMRYLNKNIPDLIARIKRFSTK